MSEQPGSTGSAPRRAVLGGIAGIGALPLVAACGSSETSGGGGSAGTGSSGTQKSGGSARASGGGQGSGGAANGTVLASTSDIPVGGGKIIAQHKVVVTQPARGDFKAFSAVCTHQGCLVNRIASGEIDCPCHGSRFSAKDGSVLGGPAPQPLPSKKIKVKGDQILLT